MRHLKHVLTVAVPLIIAAASSLAVSPAAQNFAVHHPGLALYLVAVAGALNAAYKALKSSGAAESPPNVSGPGSASMSAR